MITGDESPDSVLRSLREKAYLFIAKPLNPPGIFGVRLVRRIILTSRWGILFPIRRNL